MKNELVRFKGMVDGVCVKIDADADIYAVADELERSIIENKSFFGDGNCKIRFDGRSFSAGEQMRFENIVKKLLPLCEVSFGAEEKKAEQKENWISEYKERHAEKETEKSPEPKRRETVTAEDAISVFRSNRAKLYQGFVRDGETVRSDGHLVLLGSAEEGSELTAVGSILVIGGLYGTAHAGCTGYGGSYILAMDMRPTSLKIGKFSQEYTYDEPQKIEETEQAEDKPRRGIFDKLKKNRESDEHEDEKPVETENSALALVKNNKIELDNFTIRTFTNLKSML